MANDTDHAAPPSDRAVAASFTQQGSIDWVALAKMPISLTVGTLARLSHAGIEGITFYSTRLIFHPAKLSLQGQTRVHDALEKRHLFPTLNKALWLGLGIRHIVHNLSVTAEGLACIGICAALTEYFDTVAAASIIRELWAYYKPSQDYSPAISQWVAVLEACSGVLSTTEFGRVVGDITRLYTSNDSRNLRIISSPESFCAALRVIFDISDNKLETAYLTGGCDCALLAAIADWLFGLSVRVQSPSGDLLWQSNPNDAGRTRKVQIHVIVNKNDNNRIEEDLQVSRKCFIVDGGQTLISSDWEQIHRRDVASLGRTRWKNCIQDTFGAPARRMFQTYPDTVGLCLGSAAKIFQEHLRNDAFTGDEKAYGGFSHMPVRHSCYGQGFILAARDLLPELGTNSVIVESMEQALSKSGIDAAERYKSGIASLCSVCTCEACSDQEVPGTVSRPSIARFCLPLMIPYLFNLVRLLGSIKMENGVSVDPSVAGMERLYWELQSSFLRVSTTSSQVTEQLSNPKKLWFRLPIMTLATMLFSNYYLTGTAQLGDPSAVTANGLCFYLTTLCSLTAPPDQTSVVYITPGHILFNNHTYKRINDEEEPLGFTGLAEQQFYCSSARNINSYGDLEDGSCTELKADLQITETAEDSKVITATYLITKQTSLNFIKIGPRRLAQKMAGFLTVADCRGKRCKPLDGFECILAEGDGLLTTNAILPLGSAPIIRVVPRESVSLLVAVTQDALEDDPRMPSKDLSGHYLRNIKLRSLIQGNQCIRCLVINALEGTTTRIEQDLRKEMRHLCIVTI